MAFQQLYDLHWFWSN